MATEKENTVKAEGQTEGYSRFSRIAGTGSKVLVIGNSITRHPPAPAIGWEYDWGMAAPSQDKDFVHRLHKAFSKIEDAQFLIWQAADFERGFVQPGFALPEEEEAIAFRADIIVGRLGENVLPDAFSEGDWKRAYGDLIARCMCSGSRVVLSTCFWDEPKVNTDIRALAAEKGWPLAELSDLGARNDTKAVGLFWHTGVAAHPGELGMELIASRILQALGEKE